MWSSLSNRFSLWALLMVGAASAWAQVTSYPQVLFSPDDHLHQRLLTLIERENRHICIAVFRLHEERVVSALCRACKRGVEVEVILDPISLRMGPAADALAQAGVAVYLFDPQKFREEVPPSSPADLISKTGHARPLLHDKFCIFGDAAEGRSLVWTGSANFVYRAFYKNQENVLLIDEPAVVEKFQRQFRAIKTRRCVRYLPSLENKVS